MVKKTETTQYEAPKRTADEEKIETKKREEAEKKKKMEKKAATLRAAQFEVRKFNDKPKRH